MRRCLSLSTRALFPSWRPDLYRQLFRFSIEPLRRMRYPSPKPDRLICFYTTSSQQDVSYHGEAENWIKKEPVSHTLHNGSRVTETPPPPSPSEMQPVWTDPSGATNIAVQRQIFCNRSLTMDSIKAIGFDMDYTLAQYKTETFELLAFEETKKKLVRVFQYPKEILEFSFQSYYVMRGLVVDKKRGNLLKMDRHKYVKLAYHGFEKLPEEERQEIYGRPETRDSFDQPNYAMIDTFFSTSETYLYMKLVELREARPDLLGHKSFFEICMDVRFAVDHCHKDGSLKRRVAENPGKYIHDDKTLVPLFEMLRQSGKKIFLATNSLWDYTNIAMNHLIANKKGRECDTDWLELFDLVITGCGKPGYFHVKNPLFIVDPDTGHLINTDNGSPTVHLHTYDNGTIPPTASPFKNWKVYQGGHYTDLHRMLKISSGTEVLYVGDHMYGDILKSKKTLGWRTMLVLPELEVELNISKKYKEQQERLLDLRKKRSNLDDRLHHFRWYMEHHNENRQGMSNYDRYMTPEELQEFLKAMEKERQAVATEHRNGLRAYHEKFHPVWGRS